MNEPLTPSKDDPWTVPSRALRLGLILLASATCSYVAMAAVVSLQPPATNSLLRIPVLMAGEGEERLAGIQFDLHYDHSQYVLEAIEAGGTATEAGKEVVLSEPTPGMGRILITGFNANVLADGHVATLILRPRVPGASAESLAVQNMLATDSFGNSIPLDYRDEYDYPPRPPEKTEADLAAETVPDAEEDLPALVEEEPVADVSEGEGVSASTDAPNSSGVSANLVTLADGREKRAAKPNTAAPGTAPPGRIAVISGPDTRAGGTALGKKAVSYPNPRYTPRTGAAATSGRAGSPADSSGGTSPPDTPRDASRIASNTGEAQGLRLALVTPTHPSADVRNVQTLSSLEIAGEGGPPKPLPVAGTILFVLFFFGFAVLHVRIIRWLSGSARRRAS